MYDYLTRRESVRLALSVAWWSFCLLVCIGCAFWLFALIITSPFDVSDAVKVARLLCLGICCVSSYGANYGIGDALRHGAWVSFQRSLRARGSK